VYFCLTRSHNIPLKNIKIDFRTIRWGGMNWIDLPYDRDQWRALVNTVINLWVPENAGKFLSSCVTGGF
jgi:hypothetical protein